MAGFPRDKDGKQLADKAKTPRPGIPLVKEDLLKLIKHFHGNISRVADKLGTTRLTVRNRCNNDPDLKQALEDARERFIDTLEETAWNKAINGDTIMSLFLLKTIGKHRGYEQDSNQDRAQDIAKAAFDFVINKSKNPAEGSTH